MFALSIWRILATIATRGKGSNGSLGKWLTRGGMEGDEHNGAINGHLQRIITGLLWMHVHAPPPAMSLSHWNAGHHHVLD